MSTFSTDLKIELIGTGEQSGVWGTTTNSNFSNVFEQALVGQVTVAFTNADVTLSATDTVNSQSFRRLYLNCTGANTANKNLIVPTINKTYVVQNNTTGGYAIVVKTSAGTGITIPNGKIAAVYADGTNVVQAFDYFPSATVGTLSLTNPLTVANGGTGLTSGTSGGVPYYSSSSAITSSGVLSANQFVFGGGAGASPTSSATVGFAVSFTGANTFYNNTGQTFGTGTTAQDGIILTGRAGGTNTYRITFVPDTLTGSRTITLPNITTTMAGTDATQTLTNKRIDPRVTSAASASSLTPDVSVADIYAYTALAADLTINAPTGTPVNGDKLIFRLLDNGTSRALSWDATYTAIGVILPTATTLSKMTYVGCIYNAANTRWDAVAVVTQA